MRFLSRSPSSSVSISICTLRRSRTFSILERGCWPRRRTGPLLADPEGGELCAFVREPAKLPAYRLYEVVVDAEDHQAISRWWADRFGVEAMHDREDGFSWIEGAPGMPWELVFQAVPEPKTVKNRIHWDLRGVTEEFVAAGAHLQRRHDHEIGWDVLTDPEGNEFCVFAPPTAPSVLHGPC